MYDTRYIEHTPGQAPILRRSLPNQFTPKFLCVCPLVFEKEHEVGRVGLPTLLNGYRRLPLGNFSTAVTVTETLVICLSLSQVLRGRSRPLTFSSTSYSFSFTEVF